MCARPRARARVKQLYKTNYHVFLALIWNLWF